jgi:hypothetical protein
MQHHARRGKVRPAVAVLVEVVSNLDGSAEAKAAMLSRRLVTLERGKAKDRPVVDGGVAVRTLAAPPAAIPRRQAVDSPNPAAAANPETGVDNSRDAN